MTQHRFHWLLVSCIAVAGCSCGDSRPAGNAGASGGDAAVAGSGGGWTVSDSGQVIVSPDPIVVMDDTGTWNCYLATCEGKLLTCGNCVDDDSDGLVDARDRECLGPCDNSEGATLAADVGGQTGGACKSDCYFDFGNGSGGDCQWDHQCDPLEPELINGCMFDSTLVGSNECPLQQPSGCADTCPALTPNGCDCFGCCTFPSLATAGPAGGRGFVYIGALDAEKVSTCTFDDIADTQLCPPCTPVDNCFNDCGYCELCLGKDTLPPECLTTPDAGPPPGYRCPPTITPCGLATDATCLLGSYCISGCCQIVPE